MQAHASVAQGPLGRYLGAWQGQVSVEVPGAAPQLYTQRHTFACATGGLFLEERGVGSNGSSFLGVWSFEPQSGLYHAHYFLAPGGNAVVLSHEWNEAMLTFTGGAKLPGGARMLATDRFLDRDSYEWSIAIEDGSGRVLSRMQAREQRVAT